MLTTSAPTPFSADDPDFSPDGAYVVYSGPSKGRRELTRLDLATISREILTTDESICSPIVSPDSSRIVYGGGPGCSRLMLVSAEGGRSFDITPLDAPDTASFGEAALGWTSDGKFVTYPDCTRSGGELPLWGALGVPRTGLRTRAERTRCGDRRTDPAGAHPGHLGRLHHGRADRDEAVVPDHTRRSKER
ncbi:MAG: hypothetical protein M5U19_19660 [Microthrixaceae bacterium]|nr:hypothetical protein [Microthrixaceae bacterium]